MNEPVFINDDIKIFVGEEAEQLIKEKNEKRFFIPDVGVTKVDVSRWKEAQKFERKTWCFDKIMNNDRNDEHFKQFNSYNQLQLVLPQDVTMIELGCGPFTNMSWIMQSMFKNFKEIDLLDPLINDYIKHTVYCSYKDGKLLSHNVNLYSIPIEEFNPTKKYDLVVMINVLEHCYDLNLIFDKILSMLNDGGIFVFHDKFLNKENVNTIIDQYYDAGHPLKFSYDVIEPIIKQNFLSIFNKKYIDEQNNNCIYTILKKK